MKAPPLPPAPYPTTHEEREEWSRSGTPRHLAPWEPGTPDKTADGLLKQALAHRKGKP